MASVSLSSCEYLFSATASDLDAKAIGLSEPSGILCDRTAPTPYGEASQARINSLLGLKCTSKQDDVN